MTRLSDLLRGARPGVRGADQRQKARARRAVGIVAASVAAISLGAWATAQVLDDAPDTHQDPAALSAPGQHDVGYERVRTADGLEVHAWYPTARPSTGASDGEMRYVVRNRFQAFLPGETITNLGRATEGEAPDRGDGPYPLVVLSAGFALSPTFYSTLIEHYVSHGMVVLGPEHDEAFQPGPGWNHKILVDRPQDISTTIDLAEELTEPGGTLEGVIDTSSVAAVGHSFGGYSALAAGGARLNLGPHLRRCAQLDPRDPLTHFCVPLAGNEDDMARHAGLPKAPTGLWPSMRDTRITSVISMAGDAYVFDSAGLSSLEVPVMAMGGTADNGTPYEWGAELTFEAASSATRSLATFDGGDHMLFGAPCARLPWVSKTPYGTRGFCDDPVWRKDYAQRLIKRYSTAFLLATLRCDADAQRALTPPSPSSPGFTYTARPAPTEEPCRH